MIEKVDRETDAPPGPGFRDIAREEFWIVARSFFAPIYGTLLVWKRLARLTRRVDRKASPRTLDHPPLQPAE
jgi:hypothetical protein